MSIQRRDSIEADERDRVWDLIRAARSALLVTVGPSGNLDARPMGCIQTEFDDTLWFLTFRHSPKVEEIHKDSRVLVSYAKPSEYEYVTISGHAAVVEDKQKLMKLWFEGLRVWFPNGPDDSDIALLAVKVDEAKYWTNASSVVTYAWAYIKARLTGERPSPDQIVDMKTVRF